MTATFPTQGSRVSQEFADYEVLSEGDNPVRFGELFEQRPTLLFLLRHFGCIGCSEHMAELTPRLPELSDLGIQVVLVGNGASHFLSGFKSRFALNHHHLTVVTDPSLQLYQLLQLRHSFWGVMGLRGIRDMLRAASHGHLQTSVQGSNHQQGGTLFMDEDGIIQFYHRNFSIGDHAPATAWMQAVLKWKVHRSQMEASARTSQEAS